MNKKIKFSLCDEERIIDFVKNHEILFNVRHPKFRDSEGKNRLWLQLADELKAGYVYFILSSLNKAW